MKSLVCVNPGKLEFIDMKKYLVLFGALFLACEALLAQTRIVVNSSLAKDTINRNIYGHFAEDLGRCIYGGFYVGEGNNKISNKNGIRLDVVEALKKMKIPVLRWPGGCYADNYHWKDAIGPKNTRKHID